MQKKIFPNVISATLEKDEELLFHLDVIRINFFILVFFSFSTS